MSVIYPWKDNDTFRIGYIFSKSVMAQQRGSSDFELLLNPELVCKYESVYSYKTLANLFALGIHELTHVEHEEHDTDFATGMTNSFMKVFQDQFESKIPDIDKLTRQQIEKVDASLCSNNSKFKVSRKLGKPGKPVKSGNSRKRKTVDS
jgi:hypothetical protein